MAVSIDLKVLLKLPHVFKPIELVATFILMLLYRVPNCYWGVNMLFLDVDGTSFADMVYYGSFFICILQILSILGKDKSPILDVLLAAFGSLFFLSIGAKIIDIWRPVVMKNYGCFGNAQALGALSILTSFLYLGDACFNVITLRKEWHCKLIEIVCSKIC